MRRFAFKLAIFLTPLCLVVFGWGERRLGQVKNSYTAKLESLEHGRMCEVLILGSSHALHGLNSDFFRYRGLNMANTSQTLYQDSQVLARFGSVLPSVKYVIFCVSDFSLEADPSTGPEYWRTFFYKQYYGIPSNRLRLRLDVRNYSKWALYGEQAVNYLRNPPQTLPLPISSNGWSALHCSEGIAETPITIEKGLDRAQFHQRHMSVESRQENVQYLTESIEWCVRRHIVPILLTTPVHHTYSDHIDVAKYRWMQGVLKDLSAEYRLRYFNYFSDPRFDVDDFADSDHLNARGAEKLSRIVDEAAFGHASSEETGTLR